MESVEEKLLGILHDEVLGADGSDCNTIPFKQAKKLMRLAKEHAVRGLFAHAVCDGKVNIEFSDGETKYKQDVAMSLMQMDQIQKKQYNLFWDVLDGFAKMMEEHHIAYVVFKGFAIAQFYPNPYTRTMGDVDFYVPKKDFEKALSVIEHSWNVKIDRDEVDKHFSFEYQGIRFEMHYKIETFGNAGHQMYFDRLIDNSIDRGVHKLRVGDSKLSMLQPMEDLIVVFKHWFNHLLVEGVGLRQTLDLVVLLNAYQDAIDVNCLERHLKKIGYWKAFRAMLAMTEQKFGLLCADTYCKLSDSDYKYGNLLMEEVMKSGNFGRKAYQHLDSSNKKSIETASMAFQHCRKFLPLAPLDILCLIPKRIMISLKQKI